MLSLIVCHLASCALQEKGPQLDPFAAINPMQKFNPLAPDSPLASTVVAGWEKQFSQPDFLQDDRWHTQEGRNEIIYRLIFIADYRFFRFEGDLMAGRAAGDTVIDMAVLGLSAAGALTTPGQVTQILAAISGGLIGSRAAIQKNFFQNQTTTVLLDRMRALRQERFNAIVANLQLPYKQYPVELAIVDVFDYYNRGTMLGALQDISKNTAIKQIEAEGGDVTLTPVVLPVSKQIRLSLPQSIQTPNGRLITTHLRPEVRRRKRALGDFVVRMEREHDYSTASKILGNYGLSPIPVDESAIDRLRDLVAGIQSTKDLIPLEHAFLLEVQQSSNGNTPLPDQTPTPTPGPSPVPVSTPQVILRPDGSIVSPTPTPIPVSTPQVIPETDGSINSKPNNH
jgi:hypothetical protein